jgi:hypothetical protein
MLFVGLAQCLPIGFDQPCEILEQLIFNIGIGGILAIHYYPGTLLLIPISISSKFFHTSHSPSSSSTPLWLRKPF